MFDEWMSNSCSRDSSNNTTDNACVRGKVGQFRTKQRLNLFSLYLPWLSLFKTLASRNHDHYHTALNKEQDVWLQLKTAEGLPWGPAAKAPCSQHKGPRFHP